MFSSKFNFAVQYKSAVQHFKKIPDAEKCYLSFEGHKKKRSIKARVATPR